MAITPPPFLPMVPMWMVILYTIVAQHDTTGASMIHRANLIGWASMRKPSAFTIYANAKRNSFILPPCLAPDACLFAALSITTFYAPCKIPSLIIIRRYWKWPISLSAFSAGMETLLAFMLGNLPEKNDASLQHSHSCPPPPPYRSGDGWFVNVLPDTLTHILSRLAQRTQLLDLGPDETQPPPHLATCVAAARKGKATLIYVATDARDPRSHAAFAPLYTAYPCSFTLHDLLGNDDFDYGFDYRDTDAPPPMPWSILDRVRNPVTGASMRPLLVPLVDASVASRGSLFLGSKGSTFSGYISRLHRSRKTVPSYT